MKPWLKRRIQRSYKIIFKNHAFISHGLVQALWSSKSSLLSYSPTDSYIELTLNQYTYRLGKWMLTY